MTVAATSDITVMAMMVVVAGLLYLFRSRD